MRAGRILNELIPQVKRNCDISDARYWGFYSICGLLLRLRELYRFEKNIKPWEKTDEKDISNWIGQKESLWESLADTEFSTLTINQKEFAPFDTEGINNALKKENIFYGAGYGLYMKPVFFLSELIGQETIEGYNIYISGKEYVRDLSLHPAMLQGRTILARKDATKVLIWEKFEEFRAGKAKGALAVAFSSYGVDADMDSEAFDRMLEEVSEPELRSYIHHELGEAFETEKIGPEWTEMMSLIIRSKTQIFVRAVKDILADTSEKGTLRYIIDEKNTGSLAFYIVFLSGYRKILTEQIQNAFRKFLKTNQWQHIEQARMECYRNTKSIADELLNVYRGEKDPRALSLKLQKQITLSVPEHFRQTI
jgi:hypothetical protein